MKLGQDFADLVNDLHIRLEARFRAVDGVIDMRTSASLMASLVSDLIRPSYMTSAHRLLIAAEASIAQGTATAELEEAARQLRLMYPTPST